MQAVLSDRLTAAVARRLSPTRAAAAARVAGCALLVALAMVAVPATARAGEGCPNEAVREAQGSTYLPDCRGYELVSASEKNESPNNGVQISPDGSRVLLQQQSADPIWAVATREALAGGEGRWLQSGMVPPAQELLEGNYLLQAVSPGRDSIVFDVERGQLTSGNLPPKTLVHVDTSGKQRVLARLDSGDLNGTDPMVVSSDGGHVFLELPHRFDPEHVAGTRNVYDVGVSPPVLVSRLPDGSVPTCGVPFIGGFAASRLSSTERQGWASADGSKVFFESRGSSEECFENQPELYRRDLTTGKTVLVSGPAVAGPEGEAEFLRANATGSEAMFVSYASLVARDTNSDPDVYLWRENSGLECLTCVAPDANVANISQNGLSGSVGVSEDFSHIYFVSSHLLATGASEGVPNLYVLHGGVIKYVAPGATIGNLADSPVAGAELTPDGSVVVFISSNPELDVLTGSNNGGFKQYYRYDDRDGSLVCMSCPAGGRAPTSIVPVTFSGEGGLLGYVQQLSNNGNRFVFRTVDSLVSRDVNGESDLYEWHDGHVGLITDGVSPGGTVSRPTAIPRGMSDDGKDVFFTDFSRLTASATDGSMEVYDAREDGGEPVPSAAGVCSDESCQGLFAGAPAFTAPASIGLTGAGNFSPAVQKPKPLTRTQRLKRALRACRRKHGRPRRACEARARRVFGNGSRVRRGK
jgi:Tol biopolymer transport system component